MPNLIDELTTDPHPALRRFREQGPIVWVPDLNGWIVTTRDAAIEVMRDDVTFTVDDPRFSTAQVVGRSMLSTDGDEHDRHRAPFAAPFRRRMVEGSLSTWIKHAADQRVTDLAPQGHADLRTALAAPFAVDVIIHVLGLDAAPAAVLGWYRAIVDEVQRISAGGQPEGAGALAYRELQASVTASIASADESLLSAAAASDLTIDEVSSNAAVLMFGAIETSEGASANALHHLLTHPDQLASVVANPTLLANAVEESLRLEPSAATVDRYATKDVRIGEASVRQGDYVIVSLAAANRDPAFFAKPDVFDIHRENASLHVTFAQGPHYCLGLHVARIETVALVNACARLLPGLRLATSGKSLPTGLVFRKPESVSATWLAEPSPG